jgi:tRNA pseudouridine38-40 synthase
MRWIVRFGYDGVRYAGWARQPGLRTVEGEIRRGLTRARIVPNLELARLEVASRTDRGVSARGNVLTLECSLPGTALLRALNGIAPDMFFTAAAEVPPEFRVRKATRRTYRYFDVRPVGSALLRQQAVRLFAGPVDVRSFGRDLQRAEPVWRTLDGVEAVPDEKASRIELRAPSFVWGMVRKIVSALREVDEGRLSLARLKAAIDGRVRLSLPLAEPEPLVLWDVEYHLPWTVTWGGPNARQTRYADERRRSLTSRGLVLDSLDP